MAQSVDRASLYRAPINVWVEDEVTRAYLDALWNNPTVAFLIGGGNEGVRAIVNDAEKAGFLSVFALIDRDFRPSNRPHWLSPSKTFRTFVLPVHEIENYLLDARSLAESRYNNLGRTIDQIEALMATAAGQLHWWAACRSVVAELRDRFWEDFIPHPKHPRVKNRQEAHNHICRSAWFRRLPTEFGRSAASDVEHLLDEAHRKATQWLADGRWKTEFAGKEILRSIGGKIYRRPRVATHRRSPAQFDEDLAKEIGALQRQNGTAPAELVELLKALQQRIALQP